MTGQRKFVREDGKFADFLDTNTGALQAPGTAFIGSSNLAAPSDHIHPASGQAEYNALYRTAMIDGFAAWTFDPWYADMTNTITTTQYPSGAITLNVFYLPVALTVNGNISTVWRGSTGYSNGYVGLYYLGTSPLATTATLEGTPYNLTSTSHTSFRVSVGVTSMAAGYWAVGFLIGTQGSTPVGPVTNNIAGVYGYGAATANPTGLSNITRAMQLTGTATSLTGSLTLPGSFTLSYTYSLGFWAID